MIGVPSRAGRTLYLIKASRGTAGVNKSPETWSEVTGAATVPEMTSSSARRIRLPRLQSAGESQTVDTQEDKAYWLYVQEYFRRKPWGERAGRMTTVTVHVPSRNVLDEAAVRLFARFRDERLAPQ
jgi:hypothetical protein